MIYQYRKILGLPLFKSEDMAKRIYLPISVAPAGTGAMSQPIRAQMDCGADNLSMPLSVLKKLGIADKIEIIGEVPMSLADGSPGTAKVALVDIRIPMNGYSPVLSGVEALILEDGDEVLIGQEVLNYFKYSVHGNELVVFKPDDKKISELQPYNKNTASAVKAVRKNQLKMAGGTSVIKPQEGIKEKSPEWKPREEPSAKNDYKIPKSQNQPSRPKLAQQPKQPNSIAPSAAPANTMPSPPKPGQPPPKPRNS